MKNSLVYRRKKDILKGKLMYSLFFAEGDFYLSVKEERGGEEICSEDFPLPACSEKDAISFLDEILKSGISQYGMQELIEGFFE